MIPVALNITYIIHRCYFLRSDSFVFLHAPVSMSFAAVMNLYVKNPI